MASSLANSIRFSLVIQLAYFLVTSALFDIGSENQRTHDLA
jgi:hypothetical protein